MRVLYLDCGMGAAGDMLTAALLELLPDPAGFTEKLNALGVPGVEYRPEPSVKCGITGTHMSVLVHGAEEGEEHAHGHDHH
nr:LarC family nickel insertion protein [Lachnospiraceae bacterium]